MLRVLIVDDALTVRLYYRQILEEMGCTVSEAANGLEGMERALAEPFDLFLVDVNMPKVDGYALSQQLRTEPATRPVPILMISTQSGRDDRVHGYRRGVNHYHVKPVTPEDLTLTVQMMTAYERPA